MLCLHEGVCQQFIKQKTFEIQTLPDHVSPAETKHQSNVEDLFLNNFPKVIHNVCSSVAMFKAMLSTLQTNTITTEPSSVKGMYNRNLYFQIIQGDTLCYMRIFTPGEERNQQFFCFNLSFDLEASIQHSQSPKQNQ